MSGSVVTVLFLMSLLLPGGCVVAADLANEKIVIAHRGASGYLPEHTLQAKVLAHAQGAHYIEQDVVMSRDGDLVVLHDLTLDRMTDVAEKFPGRDRDDGKHYVIDFTLAELQTLDVTESSASTIRFPANGSRFGIHTLGEEIELIQGLNKTLGREVGLYVEAKSPWFHQQEGKDLAAAILEVLASYGYDSREDPVYLQTFDYEALKRIKEQLMPAAGMDIRLVQLIAWNDWQETFVQQEDGQWLPYEYSWMLESGGMDEVARYADGVGPSMDMIVRRDSTREEIRFTPLVGAAHAAGLQVHPFTFRRDPGQVPVYAGDFQRLLDIFYSEAGVDGVFTDFPDLAVEYLANPDNSVSAAPE